LVGGSRKVGKGQPPSVGASLFTSLFTIVYNRLQSLNLPSDLFVCLASSLSSIIETDVPHGWVWIMILGVILVLDLNWQSIDRLATEQNHQVISLAGGNLPIQLRPVWNAGTTAIPR